MKDRLTHNIGLKIMAVLFAIFLWLIVINVDDPVISQTFRGVEVTVVNDEVVTAGGKRYSVVDNTQIVNVVVKARRTVISKITQKDIVATADMKELALASQIPIAVSITGFEGKYEEAYTNPKNLQVRIEDITSKKFPLTAETSGTLRDGFVLGEIIAIPESITIGGSESIISQISRVVVNVDVTGLSSDMDLKGELVLYDVEENVIDQTSLNTNLGEEGVSVHISVLRTKSVKLAFATSGNPAEGYVQAGITHEPAEIQIAGTKEVLKDIEFIEVPSTVLDITGATNKQEIIVDILGYLPEDVQLVDPALNSIVVTVAVEKIGAKTINISVGSIVVNNIQGGMKVSYGAIEDIDLQFEGPGEVLGKMTAEKVAASIDLKQYKEPGEYEVPVLVKAPDGIVLTTGIVVKIILEKV